MNIHFTQLRLNNRDGSELVAFSPQVSFFHGPVSAGKTTIVRLIDFCLGGDLERTPALRSEFLSAQLSANIGKQLVVFEREANQNSSVRVTWEDHKGAAHFVTAPLQATGDPLVGSDVFNLSDLIFHLADTTPIKVRRSKRDPDSPLVRLSFRDVLWYCYLHQDDLDSSFFCMEDRYRRNKSIDVMRFIVGFHSDRLTELDASLVRCQDQLRANRTAIEQIREFLGRFKLGTEIEIVEQVGAVESELAAAEQRRDAIQKAHASDTHVLDPLRQQLRMLSNRIEDEDTALSDLRDRVSSQEALRAELVAAKVKSHRAEEASVVLERVAFERCPLCGEQIVEVESSQDGICGLCKRRPSEVAPETQGLRAEIVRRDINTRIDDLTESIDRHKNDLVEQQDRVDQLRAKKHAMDLQFADEMARYDSAYVSQARAIDRTIATLQERKESLERLSEMPKAIQEMEHQGGRLRANIENDKAAIEDEKARLTRADEMIQQVELTFHELLCEIGFPGVSEGDLVDLDRRSWRPFVVHSEEIRWDFFEAGSGGKKVLFNVCYALAIHKVASVNNLPLPRFLIIDSPLKNISSDVNPELVRAFYRVLYGLASGEMRDTQFILIDSEMVAPEGFDIDFSSRLMRTDDPDNPPLISYYTGP